MDEVEEQVLKGHIKELYEEVAELAFYIYQQDREINKLKAVINGSPTEQEELDSFEGRLAELETFLAVSSGYQISDDFGDCDVS